MPVSNDTFKRSTSLLPAGKAETVIDLGDKWKHRHIVPGSIAELDTRKRIYEPASNIDRTPEDGCNLKKIKIERSMKLRKEDFRAKSTNLVTNNKEPEEVWKNSFGDQVGQFHDTYHPQI